MKHGYRFICVGPLFNILLRVLLIASLIDPAPLPAQEYKFKPVLYPGGNFDWGLVTDIAQDAENNLWITSWKGLHKYDGNSFVSYRPDPLNPASISASDPAIVFPARNGLIWVGTANGLERLDPQTGIFTHYNHKTGDSRSLPQDHIDAIIEDRDGIIWIGTGGGLCRFNEKTNDFTRYAYDPSNPESLSNNAVTVVYEDRQGILWVGTGSTFVPSTDGGLNKFDKATGKFTRYKHLDRDTTTLIDDRVMAIFEDSRGVFWVGTAGDGLHTMDRSTGTFTRWKYDPGHPDKLSRPAVIDNADPRDHITFITEDATGAIWIGTMQGGLSRYDPVKRLTVRFNTDRKINTALFKDHMFWQAFNSSDGLLWMSTWEGNFYKVDPNPRPSVFFPVDHNLNAMLLEDANIVWTGTNKGVTRVNLADNSRIQFNTRAPIAKRINNDSINRLFKDNDRNIWVGSSRGLNRIGPARAQIIGYRRGNGPHDLSGDTVLAIGEDHENNIWIGLFEGGLNRLDKRTGQVERFGHDPADTTTLSGGAVSQVYVDAMQRLWVGTWFGSGLNLLDRKTGKFSHYLQGLNISAIYQSRAGDLWIGADAGLFFRDRQSEEFIPYRDPVTDEKITQSILGIVGDTAGTIWIRGRQSVLRISKKRDQLRTYGEDWGIQPTNRYAWVDAIAGPGGNIIFSDDNGYYSLFPAQLSETRTRPTLILTGLRIQDKLVSEDKNGILPKPLSQIEQLRLSHNQDNFSFEFKAIDYRSEGKNKFIYMLENYDHNWKIAGSEQAATYYNVSPGRYTFRIKVSGSDGLWLERSVGITIDPPWWRTWWAYTLYGLLLVAGVWSFIYYRSRVLRQENLLLEQKVNQRTAQLQQSLEELKAAQAQLIQSEKMASLGELTAGIAHEIQNPLNFVNNFSEVNKELIAELQAEVKKGDVNSILAIANDLAANEEKINHHGKRAEAIVKGMLQHSRTGSAQKELTDLNSLTDEYLRLAYHGHRAKDKSFNVKIETDFDSHVGRVNLVRQDIGRVILNLVNNAFYAVSEKQKKNMAGYEPLVRIESRKLGGKVELRVMDNGNGVPHHLTDKIFQPFFTTKPAGHGTGLGLSLSYEIVTKGHGGELKVEPNKPEGSVFVVQLPMESSG